MKNCKSGIVIFFILLSGTVNSQTTKIRGKVTEKATNEPIPFVNIVLKGTTAGTVSDFNGEYFIETRAVSDSVVFSCLGYQSITLPVISRSFQTMDVQLNQVDFQLNEVVVLPGENPAHTLLKKVIAKKDINNPEKVSSYTFECYNKLQFDINNFDERYKKNKLMNKLQFVFDYVDTSAITGKTYLPFLLVESVSDNYFQAKPKLEREVIKASKISGTENESVAQFTGKMYQTYNIYDNTLDVFGQGFVSPISDYGTAFYKYYLIDSAFIDKNWCYEISFKPRRKQESAFTGFVWIADTSFAVKKVQIRIPDDANLNFVNDLVATAEYRQINDSIWLPDQDYLFIDFNLTDKTTGFFGRKTTTYKNYVVGQPIAAEIKSLKNNISVADDAMKKDNSYWENALHVPLSKKEENIYAMVDSVQNLPIYKTFIDLLNLFINYYYVVGKVEVGPYYTLYSFNPIEGNRFRLGGRTSNEFSTRLMLSGHIAYGTRDNKFKYGAGVLYMLDKEPRFSIGGNFENDIQQLGKSDNTFLSDNILSSLLSRHPNDKLTMVYKRKLFIEREWIPGLSNTVSFNYKKIIPGENVPFNVISAADTLSLGSVRTTEFTLNTRFAYHEKFVEGEFERVSLGSEYPIVNFSITTGVPNIFKSKYSYFKLNLNIDHYVNTYPFGYFKYNIDAGKIYGKVPYPLLELHKGNETYSFDYSSFNMMNYYEFASDQYASLFLEHHFQGKFLNNIPLLRKLKWREVASIHGLIGSINEANRDVMIFPEGLQDVTKPYYEASVGVENIFKFLRIDAMWRLNHLSHEDVSPFGVRAMLQIIF
jgi:hypothetical protein